jgi:hypothetical protein
MFRQPRFRRASERQSVLKVGDLLAHHVDVIEQDLMSDEQRDGRAAKPTGCGDGECGCGLGVARVTRDRFGRE